MVSNTRQAPPYDTTNIAAYILKRHDANKDGQIVASEAGFEGDRWASLDGNGRVTQAELKAGLATADAEHLARFERAIPMMRRCDYELGVARMAATICMGSFFVALIMNMIAPPIVGHVLAGVMCVALFASMGAIVSALFSGYGAGIPDQRENKILDRALGGSRGQLKAKTLAK